MEQDDTLARELLIKLSEIEASLQEGDSRLVQPRIEGLHVENPLAVPGYGHEEIDFHLRLLLRRGLIHTYVKDGPLIGIYFSGLTDAGRRALGKIDAG